MLHLWQICNNSEGAQSQRHKSSEKYTELFIKQPIPELVNNITRLSICVENNLRYRILPIVVSIRYSNKRGFSIHLLKHVLIT